jgi:hypothetical protein
MDPLEPQVRRRRRLSRYLVRFAIQIPIFLTLYVASIGPMFWHWYRAHYMGGSPYVAMFYYPLLRLCQESDSLRYLVNIYIDWWIL